MRPRLLRAIVSLLLLILIPAAAREAPAASPATLSGYQPRFLPFFDAGGTLFAAVRSFNRGGEARFLVLDPERFAFREMASEPVLAGRPATPEAWRETPFARSLARHTAPPFPLQNDGLVESEHPVSGYFLTADLCPAKRPLDRSALEALAALPLRHPVPLAIMISGRWIERHPEDFAWLKGQAAAGKIAITWVNHSLTHPYEPAAPLERNFLLSPGIDLSAEVLGMEKLLLDRGLLPSPFFRFPGLVSNQGLVEALRGLNLIPIGSSAWLAKGEQARPGSIILVHANGNEPLGIRLLDAFLAAERGAFGRGERALLPLRAAFDNR